MFFTSHPDYVRMLLVLFQGALAQLGARHNGIVEATGSNPVCSIFMQNPNSMGSDFVRFIPFFYTQKESSICLAKLRRYLCS